MPERYIYTIRNLTKHFGKREILHEFAPGEPELNRHWAIGNAAVA